MFVIQLISGFNTDQYIFLGNQPSILKRKSTDIVISEIVPKKKKKKISQPAPAGADVIVVDDNDIGVDIVASTISTANLPAAQHPPHSSSSHFGPTQTEPACANDGHSTTAPPSVSRPLPRPLTLSECRSPVVEENTSTIGGPIHFLPSQTDVVSHGVDNGHLETDLGDSVSVCCFLSTFAHYF